MGFPGGSDGKESACSAGDLGLILGWEDPLRESTQPTPVVLPGESPWTEEPGRLQSMGSQESDTTEPLSTEQHKLASQCAGLCCPSE